MNPDVRKYFETWQTILKRKIRNRIYYTKRYQNYIKGNKK